MDKTELRDLLKLSIHTALEAGKEILKIYNSEDFEVELKSDNSPLTKADKVSHQVIVNSLADTKFNGEKIPVLSEEGKNIPYDERKDWSIFWLVDPLDGTKEFIKRNGEFTVNIALLENNNPILGVIYAPAQNQAEENLDNEEKLLSSDKKESSMKDSKWLDDFIEAEGDFSGSLYFAATGEGTYKASGDSFQKLELNYSTNDTSELTAVSSRSHSSDEEKSKLEELGVKKFVSVGSSLKFCLVAEGKAQVYFRNGPTMEWDVGAGYSIGKESGAEIKGLTFNKENLLNGSFSVIRK